MGLLAGKRLLITGVLTDQSIAFHVARLAQQEGAEIVLTSFGRAMSITQRVAARLPIASPIIELDVTNDEHLSSLAQRVGEHMNGLEGVLHSIGYAPEAALGGNFLNTTWADVATALHVSTFSFKALTAAVDALLVPGASVVGLDFDASVAWPTYDWMGVAKAGLEATCRYLARDYGKRGVRVNLVAAGPIRTTAAKSIPNFDSFEEVWATRAPLGWDLSDPIPAAQACIALFSDWFPATTGEIVHVDGGVHAVGA